MTGGTGSNSESVSQPEFMPDKFHSGTMNTPAIKSLGAGVKYVMKYGVDVIGKYEKMLSEKFKENLMNMDNVTVYGNDNSGGKSRLSLCTARTQSDRYIG